MLHKIHCHNLEIDSSSSHSKQSEKKRGVCRWTCRKWTLTFLALFARENTCFATANFQPYLWTNSQLPKFLRQSPPNEKKVGCGSQWMWGFGAYVARWFVFWFQVSCSSYYKTSDILVGFQKNHLRGVVVHLPVVARSLKGFFKKHAGGQCSLDVVKRSNLPWTQGADERDGGHGRAVNRAALAVRSPRKSVRRRHFWEMVRVEELKSWSYEVVQTHRFIVWQHSWTWFDEWLPAI